MAKKQSYFPTKRFLTVAVLATGFMATVYAAGMTTQTQQKASEDIDLNTSDTITQTINSDGTMGPATVQGNYSYSLPENAKGKLAVGLHHEKGTNNGNEKESNETPTLTSLVLKVSKIEVHLANICGTGKSYISPNSSGFLVPSPNNRPPTNKLTGADKWETIEIGEGNEYVDLVSLENGDVINQLGLDSLACGKYTEIRLYVTEATATYGEAPEIKLSIPGKANIVRIVRPFEIKPGLTTSLLIDFKAKKSVIKLGNTYLLKPVVGQIIVK